MSASVLALVAEFGVTVNAFAAEKVPPLAETNLGPLALAWNDRGPNPLILIAIIAAIPAGWRLGPLFRTMMAVFAGAVTANAISLFVWPQGIPDYIVIRQYDLIFNVPDLIVVLSAATLVVLVSRDFVRKRIVA